MSLYLKTSTVPSSLPVHCQKWNYSPTRAFPNHHHEDIEIIYMISGNMKCTAANHTYVLSSGDAILFNPYVAHEGDVLSSGATYICLQFIPTKAFNFPESVLNISANDLETGVAAFDEFYPAHKEGNEIGDFCKNILTDFQKNSPETESAVISELFALLSFLFKDHYQKNTIPAIRNRSSQFIHKFSSYLEDNYKNQITAEDAAAALLMSPSHLSHMVKKHFGVSFTKYLRQYRIENAINTYFLSNFTIKEISEMVGFADYSYFSRAFKECMGVSPMEYFKKLR